MNPANKPTAVQQRLNNPEKRIKREERTDDVRQGFRLVSTVPTKAPRNYYESIVIYKSGATYRLYVYEENNGVWKYATLT